MIPISEIDAHILREAYPNMSFTEDADIDRYFELRRVGQMDTALSIYNNKLKQKYPDDEKRVNLLTFYRTHDNRFYELLTENLQFLAQETTSKIKRVIGYICDTMSAVNMKDPFSLIQIVEGLVSSFGTDRFAVISECERYTRFARILRFRENEMSRASEIIRMYVTDTLASVSEYKNEQKRRRQQELESRKHEAAYQVFDFSKIAFTPAQVAAIVLPTEALTVEDTVLAYICKYWHQAFDGQFENTCLLYSRKYKTTHYDIFTALKTARARSWSDSEILQSVLSHVVSGYYYSITGDLYLHRMWQRVKPLLQSGTPVQWNPAPLMLPEKTTPNNAVAPVRSERSPDEKPPRRAARSKKIAARSGNPSYKRKPRQESTGTSAARYSVPVVKSTLTANELLHEQKKQEEKYALMKAEESKYYATRKNRLFENAQRLSENEKAFLDRQRLESRAGKTAAASAAPAQAPHAQAKTATAKKAKAPAAANAKSVKPRSKAATPESAKKQVQTKSAETTKPRTKKQMAVKQTDGTKNGNNQASKRNTPFFVPRKNNDFDPKRGQSIEDMIKKATGKSYVIYKDLFFKTVRTAIRHELAAKAGHRRSVFNAEQNTAENIIYNFLEYNYSNLYQVWETSQAYAQVNELGFKITSIEPIISYWAQECIKK